MPQCGLAPGFISIAGYALSRGFDTSARAAAHARGRAARNPTNALKYNLTWSWTA
jgi:saccharopine dehydrogenase-like NADP-dependent oxidoreductase